VAKAFLFVCKTKSERPGLLTVNGPSSHKHVIVLYFAETLILSAALEKESKLFKC
jgi:hypothetical protein